VLPAFAQQEALEVKLGNGVPEHTTLLRSRTDEFDVVVGRQPMGIVGNDRHKVSFRAQAEVVVTRSRCMLRIER
jgi:hypothetical protein